MRKPGKVPYRISDPIVKASSTDVTTWGTFWDAVDAYTLLAGRHRDPDSCSRADRGDWRRAHVGRQALVCLDLDGFLDGDTLDPRAARIVERCQSWTEISPSGTGLHIFVRGSLAWAIKGSGIEVYSEGRYMAVTGHRWPGTASRSPRGPRSAGSARRLRWPPRPAPG